MNVCGGNSSSVEMRQRKEEWVDRRGQRETKGFQRPGHCKMTKRRLQLTVTLTRKNVALTLVSSSFSSIMLQLPSPKISTPSNKAASIFNSNYHSWGIYRVVVLHFSSVS